MRGFSILALVILILLAVALYRGWVEVSTNNEAQSDKADVKLSVNKKQVREDTESAKVTAEQMGEKTREGAQSLARKLEDLAHSAKTPAPVSKSPFALEKTAVSMQPDSSVELTITRAGADLKPLSLGLTPSEGSNLAASGGMFKEGENSATIKIDALSNAHDGVVTVSSGDWSQPVKVTINRLIPVNADHNDN